jgi:hypothetical protein
MIQGAKNVMDMLLIVQRNADFMFLSFVLFTVF